MTSAEFPEYVPVMTNASFATVYIGMYYITWAMGHKEAHSVEQTWPLSYETATLLTIGLNGVEE